MKKDISSERVFTFKKFLILIISIIIIFLICTIIEAVICKNNNRIPSIHKYEESKDESGNVLKKYKGILVTAYKDENGVTTIYNFEKYIPKNNTIEAVARITSIKDDYISLDILGCPTDSSIIKTSKKLHSPDLNLKPLLINSDNSNLDSSKNKITKIKIKNNNQNYLVGTYLNLSFEKKDIDTEKNILLPKNIRLYSFDDFSIIFDKNDKKEKELVYSNNDNKNEENKENEENNKNKGNFNIFKYNGEPYIEFNENSKNYNKEKENNKYKLSEALNNHMIFPDYIIAKANYDVINNNIKYDVYKDGGSIEYEYPNYTIIKYNTLDGKNDLVITDKNIKLYNLE